MRNLILHSPRCSKSRQALALLEERNVDIDVVLYLESPPTKDELAEICEGLGVAPLTIMRTKEARFAELGLSKTDDRPAAEWIELMVANPILIERPIVSYNGGLAVGRPLENVLALL
ncbi:MAG: arsenate reductase (glutaredoxin) [Verrucomicrobia bacterium]|jgi:arsenate reductase (glutaredoxin)|nr:arsenate reductase (glutaredoxin) [Verrucomicrobiota bacterium]MBT7067605.1 arsenate reductase (glutaredoxin) [Verrucomicrobiota bacterium]MBT7700720.1 arsenate reductase (glutaredoxin) [Verrucomicrobiota bacterium]